MRLSSSGSAQDARQIMEIIIVVLILTFLLIGAFRDKPLIIEEGYENENGYHKGKQNEK